MKLTVGSLFSGIGGIDLGLEWTGGFKTIWFCENNRYASAVLKKHWPDVPNLNDITKVNWNEVKRPDILVGGFPCQDISVAGKGKGIVKGQTRSGLWYEFQKAIRILRPKYALIENVSALPKRGLHIVLAGIAQAGYDAVWFTLSAAEVGAPHKRERLFIIAYPQQHGRLEYEGCKKEVQQSEAHKLQSEEGSQPLMFESLYSIDASDSDCNQHHTFPNTDRKIKERDNYTQKDDRWRAKESQRTTDPQAPDNRGEQIQGFWKKPIPRFKEFSWCEGIRRVEDLRGRSDIPEPLVRGGDDGLSNRMDRTKCLGNAVVPQVAQVVGEMILEFDKEI